jgi:aminotransferase
MSYLSNTTVNYPKSGIRVMFELASQYPDAINLSVGEPNFETPEHIKIAAIKAINEGLTKYNPNAGLYELREAIAKTYGRELGYRLEAENVMVAVGGMEAIFLALATVLDYGDEIIIPDPAYPNYCGTVSILGGKIVRVPLYEEHGFKLQPEDLEKAITPKTKVLIINYPTNPLGAILNKEDIEKLAEVVKKHNIMVISDEVYDKIIYDGNVHYSMSQIEDVRKQVLVVNGFSKSYAMTGWRVGFIIGDKEIIGNMPKLQEGIASCLPPFIQMAAVEALRGPQDCVSEMVSHYTRRRKIITDGLNSIKGFKCLESGGSFYVFANIKSFGKSSREFAIEILKEARVVCVPGSAFGEMGEGYIRFSFANSDENLIEAVRRIKNYIENTY